MVKISKNLNTSGAAPKKFKLTVGAYHRMGRMGFFDNYSKVELINGAIYTMSPFTPDHNAHTKKISLFFTKALDGKATIGSQDAIRLNDNSEPEPDVSILKYDKDFYLSGHPTPKDILLLIEVSVFTISHDRKIKRKNYAENKVPEYWMVIPKQQIIEVYRNPRKGKYTEKHVFKKEDTWTLEVFDLKVKGSDLLI
ncbi:MAG: Uma2 family endonuclease [Bacteroidota bacterium]